MTDEVEYCDGAIRYLSYDDLVDINRWMIQSFTPSELIGVKDANNLTTAQMKPSTVRYYEQTNDMAFLAAHLMSSLARLHAFQNANKRTALAATTMFLRMNGYSFQPSIDEGIEICVGLVEGDYFEAQVASWIAENSSPSDSAELVSNSIFAIMGEVLGDFSQDEEE